MLFNTLISLALQLIAVTLNCASVHHKEIFSCQDTCRHPDLSYFQEQDVKNCSNAQEIIFSNSSINVIFIISVSTEILLLFFFVHKDFNHLQTVKEHWYCIQSFICIFSISFRYKNLQNGVTNVCVIVSPDSQKYKSTTYAPNVPIIPGMKSSNSILPYDLCHLADPEVHQILGLPVKSQSYYHQILILE